MFEKVTRTATTVPGFMPSQMRAAPSNTLLPCVSFSSPSTMDQKQAGSSSTGILLEVPNDADADSVAVNFSSQMTDSQSEALNDPDHATSSQCIALSNANIQRIHHTYKLIERFM